MVGYQGSERGWAHRGDREFPSLVESDDTPEELRTDTVRLIRDVQLMWEKEKDRQKWHRKVDRSRAKRVTQILGPLYKEVPGGVLARWIGISETELWSLVSRLGITRKQARLPFRTIGDLPVEWIPHIRGLMAQGWSSQEIREWFRLSDRMMRKLRDPKEWPEYLPHPEPKPPWDLIFIPGLPVEPTSTSGA